MRISLTKSEHELLQKIIWNVHETRRSLSVAEQLGEAYDIEGKFDLPAVNKISTTFDTLRYKTGIEAAS